jgi:hypothetical protein
MALLGYIHVVVICIATFLSSFKCHLHMSHQTRHNKMSNPHYLILLKEIDSFRHVPGVLSCIIRKISRNEK